LQNIVTSPIKRKEKIFECSYALNNFCTRNILTLLTIILSIKAITISMKKVKHDSILLLIVAACFLSIDTNAQFFKGIGLVAGANYSNQRFLVDTLNYNQNQKGIFGFNAGIFVEYLNHEYVRLITEVQYFSEGSHSTLFNSQNKTAYYCVNQLLKLRQELYDVTPYLVIGPKVELLQGAAIPGFKQLHFAAYGAIGMEFLYKKPWIYFAEIGYQRDIDKALVLDRFEVTNKAYVVRIGLKYEFQKKSKSCRTGGSLPDFPKTKD
jgi:hypothetical protein